MKNNREIFYGTSALRFYNKKDVINGKVIKINPALITILDKLDESLDINTIQGKVIEEVEILLKQGNIKTLHVDINFDDYSNFGSDGPSLNSHIFNISFLERLNTIAGLYEVFLNVHLLTDYPKIHIKDIKHINVGAVCFQLEVVKDRQELKEIIDEIIEMGACVSPVIEVVGTDRFIPKTKKEILEFILPFQDKIGMLTFQVEATGARSSNSFGMLNSKEIADYINYFTRNFDGTVQMQGGITTETIKSAIKLGSEFLVCGTEIFNNKLGYSSMEVIENMLKEADKALCIERKE
ncbi:hypothetical protein [Clostridium beijerinckii]|uniref:hypothetical protein n=1 Tax=Clostridium beijerinckii TaxID=1520 RepID=UPI00098C762A|nr:hypothetical protein [Clostridium beijerinckii]NRT77422.1 pentose-5-phosphate-3-epimerase [Clostridium beijerinckii]OOM50769.1 ribulose-phosphate 3-epimerase [Clostridium beijerinckii]